MATLLEAKVPLPDALKLAAIAMQGTMLEGNCRAAVKSVEAGLSLDEALAQSGFLDSLTCFAHWGQTKNALADAFTAAAEAFEVRTTSQAALLNMIVLPMLYLFIITFIGLSVIALIMPFMALLKAISL
jgi:type II secretory pathway component PulF